MVKCNKNMKLNRIKAVLEEKGISQTWLSKKMGKSFSTVWKSHATLTLLATQDCPLWLQYD